MNIIYKQFTIVWVFISLLFATQPADAQWQWLNLQLYNPVEVEFYDINKGAVLTVTSLLITNNGGTTFDTAFFSPGIPNNKSLNLIDSTTIAFFKGNKLYLSDNYGTTWDSVMLTQSFNSLVFLNDTVVIGQAGTSLLRSNNRGVTWLTLLSGTFSIGFHYQFPHPDTGYVSDGDTIRITYNGGTTWLSQPSWPTYKIYFPSDSVWYGVRNIQDSIYVIKTTDKGANWTFCLQAHTPLTVVNRVSFPNKETGYIGGYKYYSIPISGCGVLLGTGDGGNSWDWHNSQSCFGEMVIDINCLNSDTVYVLEFNGGLFRTTNGTDYTRQVVGVTTTTPLYEPCGTGGLYVTLNFPAKDTLVVHFDAMYGTATNGVDFMHIPDSVVFLPGMDLAEIPIMIIDDTLTEGAEFFTVVIHNTLYNDTATFWIYDEVPFPLTYQINPTERIVCGLSPNTSFTALISGGATPYSVTWYDTTGILSQQTTLPTQPILPWHRTIFVEITDNAMCNPFIDSVKLYYFDSCKVTIHSSHTGQVPAGVPVTYSLVHDCPTTGTPNQWRINGQLLYSNTEQITHTWSNSGNNTVEVMMLHLCGQTGDLLNVPVITSVTEQESATKIHISQSEQRKWVITGEHLKGNLALRVMDLGGRMVSKHDLKTDCGMLNYTLDLHHLPAGMYLLDLSSENGYGLREKILCL